MAGRDHFSPDYLESRRRFRELAEGRGAEIETLPLRIDGPDGAPLTIDMAWFGPRDAKRIVAVTSGIHGIEGFMGAAVQNQILADLPELQDGVALVLVHALNPYGYANLRRVNEDNADLNRNFLRPGEAYSGAPDGYELFDLLLNPPKPPGPLSVAAFAARAAPKLLVHGMPKLKTIVAGGQYAFPKGLFYGGGKKSNTMELLEVAFPKWFGHAEHLLVVDFHTGLGERSTYKLFIDHTSDQPRAAWLREQFGADIVQPWDAGEGVAYAIRGGFGMWLHTVFPEKRADVLAAEFGTVPAVKVAIALSMENRAHQWGSPDDPQTKAAKDRMMETFAPSDPAWRDSVVEQGRAIVERALSVV